MGPTGCVLWARMPTMNYCVLGAYELLKSKIFKGWSHVELDTCADMAERPSRPLVALWAWLPTWLCPSALSGAHITAKEGLQSKLLCRGGECLFKINTAHVTVPHESLWSQTDLCSGSGFVTCSCVISDNLLKVSEPPLLHLWNGIHEIMTKCT